MQRTNFTISNVTSLLIQFFRSQSPRVDVKKNNSSENKTSVLKAEKGILHILQPGSEKFDNFEVSLKVIFSIVVIQKMDRHFKIIVFKIKTL